MSAALIKKIRKRSARVGVIGLGYVGLPLAVEFAKQGFKTVGIDSDPKRVRAIQAGRSYIGDVPKRDVAWVVQKKCFRATAQYRALRETDAVVICVPTPLTKTREPDVSHILAAANALVKHLHRGQLIVLESTTYPGTTEEVILPILAADGLRVGKDFYLGFSPERVDPGNRRFSTRTIPKVVSGVTAACRQTARSLYEQVVDTVVEVSSPKSAEMVKIWENTFRAINIGLANEMAVICDQLGIDVWEVIEAAKTKPFGFMPFYPGPGIGGHCIPSDPMYLAWKSRLHGLEARFIELATQVNSSMPEYVVKKVAGTLKHRKKPLKNAKILLIGMTYKRNVSDLRDSPALDVARLLKERGAKVHFYDPLISSIEIDGVRQKSVKLSAGQLKRSDAVVLLANHTGLDYPLILKEAKLIVDTRNQFRLGRSSKFISKVVKL